MTWVRVGDTAATDPSVLELGSAPAADERTANEAFGFFIKVATASGAHMTDYHVSLGTAQLFGAARTSELLAACEYAGVLTRVQLDGKPMWRIINDRPELVHLRLREEVEWERQRRRDASNPALTVPVRFRDGDACRYCGRVVNWKDKKGGLRGTYDHFDPGQPATIDTFFVACGACNSSLGATPPQDKRPLLLPEPERTYYSPDTTAWVNSSMWAVRNGFTLPAPGTVLQPGSLVNPPPQRPGIQPGHAPDLRTGTQPVDAHLAEEDQAAQGICGLSADNPQIQQTVSRRDLDLPGRVGSGRAGPGGELRAATTEAARSRRSRRRPRLRPGRTDPPQEGT